MGLLNRFSVRKFQLCLYSDFNCIVKCSEVFGKLLVVFARNTAEFGLCSYCHLSLYLSYTCN